jgi:DNA modification methylase
MKNKKRNRSALKLVNAPEPEEGHNNSPKCVDPRNALNDLLAKEWIPETISVWSQKGLGAGHADAKIEKQHPAPFSYTDVSRLIRFFTKKGGLVLDPFVGIGSTLKACALEGRKGIGIELNPHFVRLARERLTKEVNEIFASDNEQKVIKGDSRIVVDTLKPDSLDFVVTSPPYWSILKKKEDHKVRQERLSLGLAKDYGNDSRDLGNVKNYDEFLEQLGIILGKCVKALKPGKYMAVIVSDFRDKSRFLMFHADLARELEKRGLQMRGLKVLYQRHKKIFPYGYPYSYVPNIHNQFILILQKPQHKK